MKDLITIRKDMKRLKPYMSFTDEERTLLDSMVDALERINCKKRKTNPTLGKKDFDNYSKLLDSEIRIRRMIVDMLSDAEKKWNYEHHRRFRKEILVSKLEGIKRRR